MTEQAQRLSLARRVFVGLTVIWSCFASFAAYKLWGWWGVVVITGFQTGEWAKAQMQIETRANWQRSEAALQKAEQLLERLKVALRKVS